ncbi:hypothetical protein CGRA01v4_07354 [Colletotrichum graminicola]|nr:hypothetical protein CGRA01v4_07354 [Colletotrichum graminicola]
MLPTRYLLPRAGRTHPHSSLRDDPPPAVVRPRGPRPRGRPGSSWIIAYRWRRVVNRRSAAL